MEPQVKFLHIRYMNEYGINPRGGTTVAFRVDSPTQVSYAVAVCHENDNYVKKVGRAKSAGRLNSYKYVKVFLGTEKEFLQFLDNFTVFYS